LTRSVTLRDEIDGNARIRVFLRDRLFCPFCVVTLGLW